MNLLKHNQVDYSDIAATAAATGQIDANTLNATKNQSQ